MPEYFNPIPDVTVALVYTLVSSPSLFLCLYSPLLHRSTTVLRMNGRMANKFKAARSRVPPTRPNSTQSFKTSETYPPARPRSIQTISRIRARSGTIKPCLFSCHSQMCWPGSDANTTVGPQEQRQSTPLTTTSSTRMIKIMQQWSSGKLRVRQTERAAATKGATPASPKVVATKTFDLLWS